MQEWRTSKAKKKLKKDLENGVILLDARLKGPRDVYEMVDRPEFRSFPYKNFRTNLWRLRNQIQAKNERTTSEMIALTQDRLLHPTASHNHRGEPRWAGSIAKTLLQKDMDEKKHEMMKPNDLYATRDVSTTNILSRHFASISTKKREHESFKST